MDYKYYTSLDGVTLDLSNQSLVDLDTPPVSIGYNVYINNDGTHTFISAKKSVNSTYNGDVFVYVYNSSSKTWSYQTSFYNMVYNGSTAFQNHEGNTGANPANFGKVVKTNNNATIAYIGIPGYRNTSVDCGAIAIVERSNTTWSFLHFITNENSGGSTILANQRFGSAIAVGGSSLFVGTSTNYSYANAGVYFYDISGTTYTKDHTFDIKPTDTTATANFGTGLACSSDGMRLFVASDYYAHEVDSTNYYTGDVHIFYYNSSISSWVLIQSCYDTIKNNVTGAAIANGSGIGKQLEIDSTGSKLLISTNLTNLHGKYGMVFYLEYEINGSTESYAFKQYLRSPVSNSISKPFGESLAISSDGNYMAIGTLSININIYHFDTTSYWQENETISQSIIDDISSNEYTNTTMLDNYANSLSMNSDGKLLALGISNYRYNNPSTISGKVSGQAFVYYAKVLQSITSFEDIDHGYDVTATLSSSSNGSGNPIYFDPEASTIINTIYQFVMTNKVKIIGLGSKALAVRYPEDSIYVETTKIIQVIGRTVDQYIDYTAAISTQGFIGIGQTSGLAFETRNVESGELSKLSTTLTISGDTIAYDPITKEIEGVKAGVSTITLSQSGDSYYNAVVSPIVLTYDVSANWSNAYPGQYNPGYTPSEGGMTFGDHDGLEINPSDASIGEKLAFGFSKKDANETVTYSIPLLEKEMTNELKRTLLKRDAGTFQMEIKDISGIDYVAVSLHDVSKLGTYYNKLSSEDGARIVDLENKTDFFQIEKYKSSGGGDYVKNTSDYVSVRLYHPYDTLVIYHIDSTGTTMTEVTTDNFPDSQILREHSTSDYWYVKMPFSTGIGGTESIPSGVICFRKHSVVECDQGPVEIQDIDTSYHTIQNMRIVSVTRSLNSQGEILYVPRDTFGKNTPNQNTYISFLHKIKHNGAYTKAIDLYSLYPDKMEIVNYQGVMYNVLLESYDSIIVNGCTVESLFPNDDIAKLYRSVLNNKQYSSTNKRDIINLYNKKLKLTK